MLKYYGIIRDAAKVIEKAAADVSSALNDEIIEQEPDFTNQMIGSIRQAMNGYRKRGIHWEAKTLTDRGRNSQESVYGADFMGVLNIDLSDYRVSKGFLAQAKLIREGRDLNNSEYDRMQNQCERMLRISPASFVFLYSKDGIYVVSAISIVSTNRIDPYNLYGRSIRRFYEEHFSSFIGDRRLNMPHVDALKDIAREFEARSALALSAKEIIDA